MVVNRKKKANKFRGSNTHGWGSPKKHRGSGSRGGVGNAGAGKKGQQKMTTKHNLREYIGRYGFTRPPAVMVIKKTINIDEIEKHIDNFIAEGCAKKGKDIVEIDISKAGYDKVLGRGKITTKMKITAGEFSKGAIDRIQKAEGTAITIGSKEPSEEKEKPKKEQKPAKTKK